MDDAGRHLLEELVQLRHDQISGSEIVAYPRLYKTGYLSNWLAASCPGKDYEDWPAKDIANFLDPPPWPFNGPEVDQRTARNLRGGRAPDASREQTAGAGVRPMSAKRLTATDQWLFDCDQSTRDWSSRWLLRTTQ